MASPCLLMRHPKLTRRLSFCAIYLLSVVLMILLTRGAETTGDFDAIARRFTIAGVETTGPDQIPRYRVFGLEDLNGNTPDLAGFTFLLPAPSITIDVGDIHHVSVLEDHGIWQLVQFNYSNSHTSRSVYRAFADHVEPVSYRITSHIGQGLLAIMLIVPVWIINRVLLLLLERCRTRGGRQPQAGELS